MAKRCVYDALGHCTRMVEDAWIDPPPAEGWGGLHYALGFMVLVAGLGVFTNIGRMLVGHDNPIGKIVAVSLAFYVAVFVPKFVIDHAYTANQVFSALRETNYAFYGFGHDAWILVKNW